LLERLHEEIVRAGGAIGFSRYMELALYAPGLGYYSGGAAKLGPAGDFVTAPEVSDLFGRCVGRQAREALEAIGGGEVLELGGGSGALAEAALAEGGRAGMAHARAQRGAARAAARAARRARALARDAAARLPGRHRRQRGGRRAAGGALHDPRRRAAPPRRARRRGGLAWALMPPDPAFAAWCTRSRSSSAAPFPEGYTSEFCPMLQAWVRSLAEPRGRACC
jgi:hypothetical protein